MTGLLLTQQIQKPSRRFLEFSQAHGGPNSEREHGNLITENRRNAAREMSQIVHKTQALDSQGISYQPYHAIKTRLIRILTDSSTNLKLRDLRELISDMNYVIEKGAQIAQADRTPKGTQFLKALDLIPKIIDPIHRLAELLGMNPIHDKSQGVIIRPNNEIVDVHGNPLQQNIPLAQAASIHQMRFEDHSIGEELQKLVKFIEARQTKQAIEDLNEQGITDSSDDNETEIINQLLTRELLDRQTVHGQRLNGRETYTAAIGHNTHPEDLFEHVLDLKIREANGERLTPLETALAQINTFNTMCLSKEAVQRMQALEKNLGLTPSSFGTNPNEGQLCINCDYDVAVHNAATS